MFQLNSFITYIIRRFIMNNLENLLDRMLNDLQLRGTCPVGYKNE